MRGWPRHRMGISTAARECPDCGCPIVVASNGRSNIDAMHTHARREEEFAELRDMVLALWGDRPAPPISGDEEAGDEAERARPPLADRVPVAYEHRLLRDIWQQIRALFAPRPAAELTPAIIPAAAAAPPPPSLGPDDGDGMAELPPGRDEQWADMKDLIERTTRSKP